MSHLSPPALRWWLCVCVAVLVGACDGSIPATPAAPTALAQPLSLLASSTGRATQGVIEALFFGTGPLARTDNPGCDTTLQRMRGWSRGSRVRVVAYASVDADRRESVKRALERAGDAFGTTVTTTYQHRDDLEQPEGNPDNEISVFAVPAAKAPALCGISAANCQVVRYNSGAYVGSRVILSTPFAPATDGIVAHEMGHAFGLCHIDPARAGLESMFSVMGNSAAGRWTAVDVEAIRLVYGAGLSPSDPRQRFVAAGLID
jgi:hypothetical protein